ncbi:MAG TPA: MBL fold metallo-hydrolase, partial [Candidatus Tectomicrobia bacterium]|nr:MBL fold metallo-hydrolase [Candidatus Tectomicrobia bacterium]
MSIWLYTPRQEVLMASTPTASATVSIASLRAPQGCVAYLVVDDETRTALAVDPRLDQVDSLVETASARGARIACVMDTHTHADHLSGARQLARRTGAVLLAHAASKLRAPARRVRGGDTVELGATTVTVIDAPGHTPDSVALHVGGHLFTGDALFAGGAGRTDFMGGSASDLFDTLRTFAALPDTTVVHPGHDYVGRPTTTIADEKAHNPLLLETDRAAFVARMAGTAEPPPNMAAILRHNLAEADGATVAPRELEGLRGGEPSPLVLDVRTPLEFESERIEGSVNVPLDQLDARIDELPEGRDVVVVCRTGVRATIAADVLGRAGRGARVLEGGVQAWRRAGLPLREGRK